MKLKYMWLALIPLCMASCSEEETIVSDASQREVRVTAGASNHSRVVLNDEEDRISSLWEAGDKISLFTATQSNLVYSTDANAATAVFTPVDEALQDIEGNTVYACYPEVSRTADEGMVVGLPSTATMDYDNGSIRSFGYATSTISGGSVNFQFKHISAFIALEVKPEMLTDATKGISRITVSTSSSQPLSVGEGDTFDFSTQTVSATNGTDIVQINVDNHVVDSLWTVYIPVLPQPAGADITITLTDSENQTLYTQIKQTPENGFVAGHTYYQKAVEEADVAYLVDGTTFNGLIKQLANGDPNFSYESRDDLMKRIEFVGESSAVPADYVVVSTEDSPALIYASFNSTDGLLTISTGAKRMEMVDASYMFFFCSSLISLDLSSFDTSNVADMTAMFLGCSSLDSLDLSGFDTSNVTNMRSMFSNCSSLESLDLSNFDTSNVTYMRSMLEDCSSLESLDLSGFDTSNVTNMSSMFEGCSSLSSLDLSNFNTSSLTGMSFMFEGCSSLSSLDLSNFNTSNVIDMSGMFADCSSLESLDLTVFDTSNVTGMNAMFLYCTSLESLDLSSFDTSNVTNMGSMFSNCSSLVSLDLSSFDTSEVTEMQSMFEGCSSLGSLNLSNFDMGHVTDMSYMFEDCASTSKACRVTSMKDLKDFLLGKTEDTKMNPDWFIWEDAANGGEESDTFSVVGTWEMIEGNMEEWIIILREDGTGKEFWVDAGYNKDDEFTYSLDWENRKLYISTGMEFDIVSYSDTEVTLRYSWEEGTEEFVFRRVDKFVDISGEWIFTSGETVVNGTLVLSSFDGGTAHYDMVEHDSFGTWTFSTDGTRVWIAHLVINSLEYWENGKFNDDNTITGDLYITSDTQFPASWSMRRP